MKDRISTISNVLFIVAVVCLLARLGYQTFHTKQPQQGSLTRTILDWRQYGTVGHRMGSASAPATIVEFAAFECPVCRAFTLGSLQAIRRRYGDTLAVVFRHLPLSYHHLALPAARASECAAAQGRFEQCHDLLYAKEHSLGVISFDAFAKRASVPDLPAFQSCDNSAADVAVIDSDVAAGGRLKATGIPTLLINETLVNGAPDSTHLDSLVRAALGQRAAAH